MKKTTITIVMAKLCLIFSAHAQNNQAIDLTKKGIQIGQTVPDILIKSIYNYKSETLKLSELKGKLLILDFWATWCTPCIAMIPKMEHLQEQFGNKIQFLTVSYEKENKVLPFLKKIQKEKPSNLPVIIGDTLLHQLFPHKVIPHYVWIDENGIVSAITGLEEITADHISKFLQKQPLKLQQKHDLNIPFDQTKPMQIAGNGGNGDNLLYHAILTGYTPGIGGKFFQTVNNSTIPPKIVLTNAPIAWFYKLAYGNGTIKYSLNNNIKYEVKDPSKLTSPLAGAPFIEWMKNGNAYCYELILPSNQRQNFYTIFQQDLKRIFSQYTAAIETRKVKCLALIRTSCNDRIKSQNNAQIPEIKLERFGLKIHNSRLSEYIDQLMTSFQSKFNMPLLDKTGYTYAVDLEISGDQTNVETLNQALAKYDLKWVEQYNEVETLVIRDNPNQIQTKSSSL